MIEPTDAGHVAGRHARRRLRVVFAVTALGAFMASLDLSIVNVAFPALERSFPHDAQASLARVITGYSIVFGALLVVAGRTADRLGSRRVFFAGLAVFCVGSVLAGVAPSVPLLVAGRLVQGVGAAALLPSSLGLLLAAYPSDRRSQVVSLWGGIGALAVATGPSLGAVLITGFGWRSACAPWCWPSPKGRPGDGPAPGCSAPSPPSWCSAPCSCADPRVIPSPVSYTHLTLP